MPLVGAPTPKFVFRGNEPLLVVVPPEPTITGGAGRGGKLRTIGLVPTAPVPENRLRPLLLAAANANWVPISREKVRFAATTRASISTCCDLRSSCRIRLSRTGRTLGISRIIRVFERLSASTSPREERNFFSVVTRSDALASL